MSNAIDIKLVLQILELVATWQKDSVTIEDVEQLKERLKHPDGY